MTTSELDTFLQRGTRYIEAQPLIVPNPEDGLIDHGPPQDQVVKAWPTKDEAAVAEASLPVALRRREAQVLADARDERRGDRFRLLMETTTIPGHQEPAIISRNEGLALAALFVVIIALLTWNLLPLIGFVPAVVALYGTDD